MKTIRNLTLAAVAATLLCQTSITLAAAEAPLRITFRKCFVEDHSPDYGDYGGYYQGTVGGDLGPGNVNFSFQSLYALPGGVVLQFSGVYTITRPDGTVLVAAYAEGIDNLRSRPGHDVSNLFGHDVLNGVVIAGARVGAHVQVSAKDTDGGACSEGTITINPRH